MASHSTTPKWREPWALRKLAYIIVGFVGLVLWYFGFIEQDQADALANSPLLATLVSWIAASKTHEGSDSTATEEDVARERTRVERAEEQLAAARKTESKLDDATALLELTAARLESAGAIPPAAQHVAAVSKAEGSLPVYTGPGI